MYCEKHYTGERVLDYDKVLLRNEGPGILNWALEGLLLLLADFDQNQGKMVCKRRTAAKG